MTDGQKSNSTKMEASEIIRRNVAIVEYMDGETSPDYPDAVLVRKGRYLRAEWSCDLKYHNDWSWLMPVVENICDTRDTAYHFGKSFKRGWFARFGMDNNSYGETAIEAAWMAVSDYIISLEK